MADYGQTHNCTIREGCTGDGKTHGIMVDALKMLENGGVVAFNFPLKPGWAWAAAGWRLSDLIFPGARYKRAIDYYNRCFYVGTVSSIEQLSKRIPELVKGEAKKRRERKAFIGIDEAQLFFNARHWQKNFEWIQWLTQARKQKWAVALIAHGREMIDAQIRDSLVGAVITHRNLNKIRIPLPFLRKIPVLEVLTLGRIKNLFFQVSELAGAGAGAGSIDDRAFTPYRPQIGAMYDTDFQFNCYEIIDEVRPQGDEPVDPRAVKRSSNPAIRQALQSILEDLDLKPDSSLSAPNGSA